MEIKETIIKDCFVIHPGIIEDERGLFSRVFCDEEFETIRSEIHFKQINHSFNKKKGTFRGMHYQEPPYCEEKLIRCIAGSVIDFVLDLRNGSETFLTYISINLSSCNRSMIYLPKGVAHGFLTLEDDTELIYHHTVSYHKEADRGLRFDDPKINIKLPYEVRCISDKDKNYTLLTQNFSGLTI